MKLIWLILIGIVIGLLSGKLTKETDLGNFGNILSSIIGALTGYFAADSLALTNSLGLGGIILVTSLSAVLHLFLMRKISKAF